MPKIRDLGINLIPATMDPHDLWTVRWEAQCTAASPIGGPGQPGCGGNSAPPPPPPKPNRIADPFSAESVALLRRQISETVAGEFGN
jgi:hypothetical protein